MHFIFVNSLLKIVNEQFNLHVKIRRNFCKIRKFMWRNENVCVFINSWLLPEVILCDKKLQLNKKSSLEKEIKLNLQNHYFPRDTSLLCIALDSLFSHYTLDNCQILPSQRWHRQIKSQSQSTSFSKATETKNFHSIARAFIHACLINDEKALAIFSNVSDKKLRK